MREPGVAAAVLTLAGTVHAASGALPKTTDDLLAITDAEAILFAAKAAPSPAFLEGARFYRLAPDRRSLRQIKDGPGPWNFVAGIPNDIAPIAVDEGGLKRVRALLAGEKPQLDRPRIGFLWAGNQFVPPGTQELRPLPPGVMVNLPIFGSDHTKLQGVALRWPPPNGPSSDHGPWKLG